jgi:hypothetical protein
MMATFKITPKGLKAEGENFQLSSGSDFISLESLKLGEMGEGVILLYSKQNVLHRYIFL